jgi:hypothetical protein
MTTDETWYITATIPVLGGHEERTVPDLDTAAPLRTSHVTAEQTCKYLDARAPNGDTFKPDYGLPPQRQLYDMSRLGERAREVEDVPTE